MHRMIFGRDALMLLFFRKHGSFFGGYCEVLSVDGGHVDIT